MPYNDLRKGRHSAAGMAYHVIATTAERRPYFLDWRTGRIVVRHLALLEHEGVAETLCFVVMPDHLHWLMILRQGTLGEAMRRLKARASREFGKSLWQTNFYDHAVRADEGLRVLAR